MCFILQNILLVLFLNLTLSLITTTDIGSIGSK